jgi:peroxiredoxin
LVQGFISISLYLWLGIRKKITIKNNMIIKVGDKAPDFTLHASDTTKVSLSEYEGKKVILLFFPLAFTRVCTTELCTMRDDISTYNNMNASVLAVSVDSLFSLAKFKEEQKLNFPLLSDFNKTASRSYGALYEDFVLDMKGVSKRSAFVIDEKGIIRYAEVLENALDLPNFAVIREILENQS